MPVNITVVVYAFWLRGAQDFCDESAVCWAAEHYLGQDPGVGVFPLVCITWNQFAGNRLRDSTSPLLRNERQD